MRGVVPKERGDDEVVLEDAESLGETRSEEGNKNIRRVRARRERRKGDKLTHESVEVKNWRGSSFPPALPRSPAVRKVNEVSDANREREGKLDPRRVDEESRKVDN